MKLPFFVPNPNLIFVSLTLIPWTENAQTTLSCVLKSAVFCSTGQRGTSLVVCHLNKYNHNCNTSWLAGSGNRLPCGKSFLSKALFTTKSRREKSYKHALIIRHQLITRRKYLNSVPLDTDCIHNPVFHYCVNLDLYFTVFNLKCFFSFLNPVSLLCSCNVKSMSRTTGCAWMTFTHMNKFASFQALNQPFPINLLYSLHVVVELSPKGTEALIKPQQLSAIGSFTLITQRKLVPKWIQKQKSLFTVQQRSRSNIKQSASGNHFNWTFHFVISQAKTPTLFLKRQPLWLIKKL